MQDLRLTRQTGENNRAVINEKDRLTDKGTGRDKAHGNQENRRHITKP